MEKENKKMKNGMKNEYNVRLDGGEAGETTIQAWTDEEAIQKAIDWAADGDWNFQVRDMENMIESIEVRVIIYKDNNIIYDEDVQIDPDEPPCVSKHGHDWNDPIARSNWIDEECENCHIVRRKYYDSDKISYIFPDDKEVE